SGLLANTVTATSDRAPAATDRLLIPIVRTPALTLVKSASPLSYDHVGQLITYTYKVTNTGNVTLSGPFTVNDDTVTVTCPSVAPPGPAGPLTCTATHPVAQADLDAGSIVNVASTTNGVVTSPTDKATVQAVQKPSLVVVKSTTATSLTFPQTVDYSY